MAQQSSASFDSSALPPLNSPLRFFEENKGQWASEATFRLIDGNKAISLFPDRFSFALRRSEPQQSVNISDFEQFNFSQSEYLVWDVTPLHSNKVYPIGRKKFERSVNYFGAGNPIAQSIESYSEVAYKNLYDGVDFMFYTSPNGAVKYDIHVAPGAEISNIKLLYNGVDSLAIGKNGQLLVYTAWGEFTEDPPISYQRSNDTKIPVDIVYQLNGTELSFKVRGAYNPNFALIIDPLYVDWSTYFYSDKKANSNFPLKLSWITSVDFDDDFNCFISGFTSEYFPDQIGVYDSSFNGNVDGFLCKLNKDGDSILFFTYLGGSVLDFASEFALTRSGDLVLAGITSSPDFPLKNAIDSIGPSNNSFYKGFVTQLSPDGKQLIFSTYLGGDTGSHGTYVTKAVVDNNDRIYIAGFTTATNFPTTSTAFQPKYGGRTNSSIYGDGFISVVEANYGNYLYGSYLGGTGEESIYDLQKDLSGNVYLAGFTNSSNFPITTGHPKFFNSTPKGTRDGFIIKFDSTLNKIAFSHLMGGNGSDFFHGIHIYNDQLYLLGNTNSSDFPTTSRAKQTSLGGGTDAVVCKLTSNGVGVQYSTYFGGSGDELVDYGLGLNNSVGIVCNVRGEAFIVGSTTSTDLPVTQDAFQRKNRSAERRMNQFKLSAYVSKLSRKGDQLLYGTYWGGNFDDHATSASLKRVDCETHIVVAGYTRSTDFPTTSGVLHDSAFDLSQRDTFSPACSFCGTGFISRFIDTLHLDTLNLLSLNVLGDTIIACGRTSIGLDAGNYGGELQWSHGPKENYVFVSDTGWYWVRATYGCDTMVDSVYIVRYETPISGLGRDTIYCDNFPILQLRAEKSGTAAQYKWSTGATSGTVQISNPGKYWVNVNTAYCGSLSDTIRLGLQETPVLSDYDTVLCDSTFLILDAGFSDSTMDYRWSTGQTTKQIQISQPGSITQYLSSACGSDSAKISIVHQVTPRAILPEDTVLCDSSNLLLRAGIRNNGEKYIWSDVQNQVALGQSDSLQILAPTVLQLQIENSCGIDSARTSISVQKTPDFQTTDTVVLCDGEAQVIGIALDSNLIYTWDNGSSVNYIQVWDSGSYQLNIRNYCGTQYLTWAVLTGKTPDRKLPGDTILCDAETFLLNVDSDEDNTQYIWQDGTTTPHYEVRQSGLYFVEVSNVCGILKDTIQIRMLRTPKADLGNDSVQCGSFRTVLKSVGESDNGETYLWQDGKTTSTNQLNTPGTYWVQIENFCGTDSDTILLGRSDGPVVDLGSDMLVCDGFDIELDAMNPGSEYSWQPFGETTQRIITEKPALYSVVVTDSLGCEASDAVEIILDCENAKKLPNAFSPNGDALNDFFGPFGFGYDWEISIYSGTGQLLYKGLNSPWDGKTKGEDCPADVYFYHIRFWNATGSESVKGMLHLMR
ncbi:MAG: gliding motility-associated C-terminal domain-containing protein [Flavobacteriales bacterium]|nr:gliding motility-associated C-terminal domain-containing protein [Flavobacteriales bacterium]